MLRSPVLTGGLTRLALCIVCIVVALQLPLYIQASAMPAMGLALGAMGWAFQSRSAGDLSLAYGVFFGCGAYFVIVLANAGATSWVGILVGMLVAAAFAAVISAATHRYRVRGVYYTFASLAVNLAAVDVLESTGLFGGVSGTLLTVPGRTLSSLAYDTNVMLAIAIATIFVVGTALVHLERSRSGHIWRALREDEDAAAGLGVDVRRYKIAAASIGAMIAALGGSLTALALALVTPESALDWHISVNILVASVFGGTRRWWFAAAGAALVIMGPDLVATNVPALPEDATTLVYGVALLVVVYLLPDGLFGLRLPGATRLRRLRRGTPHEPAVGQQIGAAE